MSSKESALRSRLIRLAAQKPELRGDLLPLLASGAYKQASLLSDDTYSALSDTLYDMEREFKAMKAKTNNPEAKKKLDAALKALKEVGVVLDKMLDME